MTQSQVRALRKGQHVVTPDGAVARITTDPYPRPGTVDVQVGARYRNHAFTLSHHNSHGWTLAGDPSDRFVYALPDLEDGPLSEACEDERQREYREACAAWERMPRWERRAILRRLWAAGVDLELLHEPPRTERSIPFKGGLVG